MTIPVRGWLVLRCVPSKRLPQHSDQRKWVSFGVERRAFSSESHFDFEISQRFAKMAASEAANGKSRVDQVVHASGEGHVLEGADEVPVLLGELDVADDFELLRVAAAQAVLVGQASDLFRRHNVRSALKSGKTLGMIIVSLHARGGISDQ